MKFFVCTWDYHENYTNFDSGARIWHCARPNMDHNHQLTYTNNLGSLLRKNLRLVRRQMYFKPTIQQRLYVNGGYFQEYVVPELAGCRPRQFCMPKWININAGAHF